MNQYTALRRRQQEEFNALPLGFAFGQKQFNEMMERWGLDPDKDLDKISSIGAGGYIQKKDAALLHQTRERHAAEMAAAIAEDRTGKGFIYEMFLCELENHEYSYTRDTGDALDALGYTAKEVVENPRLKRGLEKAIKKICRKER